MGLNLRATTWNRFIGFLRVLFFRSSDRKSKTIQGMRQIRGEARARRDETPMIRGDFCAFGPFRARPETTPESPLASISDLSDNVKALKVPWPVTISMRKWNT